MTIRLSGERHKATLRHGSSSWLLCVSMDVGPAWMSAETARAIGLRFGRLTAQEHAALARYGFLES